MNQMNHMNRHGAFSKGSMVALVLAAALMLTACQPRMDAASSEPGKQQTAEASSSAEDPSDSQAKQTAESEDGEKGGEASSDSQTLIQLSDSQASQSEAASSDAQASESEAAASDAKASESEAAVSGAQASESEAASSDAQASQNEADASDSQSSQSEESSTGILLSEIINESSQDSTAELRALYPEAAAKLDEIGWDLRTAYDWVASFHYVDDAPIDWELGTKWYASYGFETGEGHCYTFAAMMTEFARLLGYESRQAAGNLIGNNPFHHSWVEIDIDGVTYVLDPEVQQEWNQDCYLVIYGEEGTIPYDVEAITYMTDESTPESLERLRMNGWWFDQEESTDQEYDPNTGCLN